MKKKDAFKLTLAAWPVVFLVAVGSCWLTSVVAGWFGIDLPDQPSLDMVRRARGWELAFWIALVAVAAPVAEELIFRFLLFKVPLWIVQKVRRTAPGARPVAVAALVSSALFSAAHYVQMPFPNNAFLALAAFGLCQCALYRRTARLWSPMLNHALFNLTNLALLFVFPAAT